jgi:hypothetical protein
MTDETQMSVLDSTAAGEQFFEEIKTIQQKNRFTISQLDSQITAMQNQIVALQAKKARAVAILEEARASQNGQ